MVLSAVQIGHSKLHGYQKHIANLYNSVCDKSSSSIVGKLSFLIERFDEAWWKSLAAQGVLEAEVE